MLPLLILTGKMKWFRIDLFLEYVIMVYRSRRLLENIPGTDTCSSGDVVSLHEASDASSGEITIAGKSVCGVGESEVIYDIGSLDSSGEFIPSVLSAHSQVVTVQAGPPSCFQFVIARSQPEKALYALRSTIYVQVMDAGRNVCYTMLLLPCAKAFEKTNFYAQFVNASFNYSLVSPNTTTVSIIVSSYVIVVFNSESPFGCQLPVLFLALSSWTNQAEHLVLIGGSSKQYQFVGRPVQLYVTSTCSPGFFVNVSGNMLGNVIALYDFLLSINSSAQLCSRCSPGTFSTSNTMSFCLNCTSGTFANANNTECLPCPIGTWSQTGEQGACRACSSNISHVSYATTKERDHCLTLEFFHSPPSTVVSGSLNKVPSVALVDVFDSTIVPRSGNIRIQLQCRLPQCQTDSDVDFDLITATLYIQNGLSVMSDIFLPESSQLKIGTGFVWHIFTSQEPDTIANTNINSRQYLYPIIFVGDAASISAVTPTQVASVGGTNVIVSAKWNLHPRVSTYFVNSSSFCVFKFFGTNSSSSDSKKTSPSSLTEHRILAIATSQDALKTCRTPAIPEFLFANITIELQDGRLSAIPFSLQSVCHNGFYIFVGKCQPCPKSSVGRSSNDVINAPSLESCICSVGSYGIFGEFCRFCPTPSSLPVPPFICNSSNLRYPVVAPGYWVDYSLLSRCDATSATCPAVTTCACGARACPGGGEKVCTQSNEECYEGKGCSECCSGYYNENNACFKCPDPTQTTALLAVVAVICILLAVLMSSVSSPSFTHSSKNR